SKKALASAFAQMKSSWTAGRTLLSRASTAGRALRKTAFPLLGAAAFDREPICLRNQRMCNSLVWKRGSPGAGPGQRPPCPHLERGFRAAARCRGSAGYVFSQTVLPEVLRGV